MDKAKVIALIVVLYALEIAARAGMIKDAAKENGVKEGDLYKFLKEAGYDPNAPKGTAAPDLNSGQNSNDQNSSGQDGNGQNKGKQNNKQAAQKIPVLVSHKTEYEKYRCAGLALTRKPENYLVTKEQLDKLKRDPWVALKE